jgi:hypothetical protein
MFVTIILGILFRNKRFVQNITQRTYLVIGSGHKIDLKGNFGCLLGMLFVSPFFQGTHPEKRGLQIYYTNLPMFTIKSLPSYIKCHDSLDPLF